MLLHQGIPLTQFTSCPVCQKEFDDKEYQPISLACDHTVCKSCILNKLGEKKCPFDSSPFPDDVDQLPANYALMQVIGAAVPEQGRQSPSSSSGKPKSYVQARQCIEEMAIHLKPVAENSPCSERKASLTTASSLMSEKSVSKCVLSRPIQRKLISLIHCQLLEEEGRSRSARIARSIGERIVTELLSLQQYPQQLSANLWAAVRTRGCQFLGPAMQEEVLKLILLALEDGSFLSRKVLVLFVVQKLESRYPQASKTAIGHVVQLLYRASCFKVTKRDEASSLMQLKEEFRQYDSLRKEHDAQIVQIALEAGLRIPPDHWSSLLYGDSSFKSHMQSIIDKHQSSQSFAQCITELTQTLGRNGDPCSLLQVQPQLEFLSGIDPSPDCPAPSWENLEAVMRSLNIVMKAFIGFLSGPDYRMRVESMAVPNTRYKTSMCRDFAAKNTCPRGASCTFAHSQDELERHRVRSRRVSKKGECEEQSETLSLTESHLFSHLNLSDNASQSDSHVSSLGDDEASAAGLVETLASSCHGGVAVSTAPGYSPVSLPPSSRSIGGFDASCENRGASSSPHRYQPPVTTFLSRNLALNEFPPSQSLPSTRLTFSGPGKEVPEMPSYPSIGPQTCMRSHNRLSSSSFGGHPAPSHPPLGQGMTVGFQHPNSRPSHGQQAWLDPQQTSGQRPLHSGYEPVNGPAAPLSYQYPSVLPPPPGGVSVEHFGSAHPNSAGDYAGRSSRVVMYPCTSCQPPPPPPHGSNGLVASDPSLPPLNEVGQVIDGTACQTAVMVDASQQPPLPLMPPGIALGAGSLPGYRLQPLGPRPSFLIWIPGAESTAPMSTLAEGSPEFIRSGNENVNSHMVVAATSR